ncbi:MAG TPA: hypothetical protein VN905_09215 [Candidatus Binatia bacterium]|nr:hypothetical protein [Candidatus Binatia bacterium]
MLRYVMSLAILSSTFAALPAPANAAPNPIVIQHCFITVPKAFSHNASGTQIVYVNRGPKAAVSVNFQVAYRNASRNFVRYVVDEGVFSPGDQIDHHFSLYSDVTFAGKQTSSCKALSVTWADGSRWRP